jgi:hypothetical protein
MSYTPNNAWNSNPQTGLTSNPGPFLAEVMKNNDPLYSGRLLVYIPEFGGDPEQESSWHLVRYMSPYYGIQPLSNRLAGEPAEAIESYGMWMTPPDLGVKVLVMFINGDRSKGVWMGCLPEIGSHGSIPGNDKGDFDVFANQSLANNNIQDIPRPEHSTAPTFDEQGLGEDPQRGKTITTSSLRESPSKVFGMNTPSGHSFFMDDGAEDGTNKMLRLRTASGNMIMMNDDTGFVYIINAKGTGWIELSPSGFVDVYGEQGISIGTPGNIDMHASGNINMHAGQNIKMVADKEAKFQGTEKTKIYGGNLFLQGSDSLQMYSCGRIKLTGNAGLDFKSEKNFVLEGRIFKWNSGSAGEAEQVPPDSNFDITGYKSTVLRAPNREPWQGHEESYEETPKGKLTGPDLNLNNPLDAFGGPGDSSILSGVANSNLSQITQEINVLPEKLRQPAFENIGIGGNILEIEKSLKENIGVDRIDIGNISTIVGSGNNLGAALTGNIAQNINITGALPASNIVDTVFADNLGSISNIANQVGNISNIGNTIETINLKDLSLNGVLDNLDGVEQLSRQLNFSLPNSPLIESALSIKSNIRNAESLVGQLSTPLTSLSALASAPSFSGLSGLIESNIDADRLTRSLGKIVNVPGLNQITAQLAGFKNIPEALSNIPGALSNVIGNIPNLTGIANLNNISQSLSQVGNISDIGSITDVVDNLPIGIPDNIANIVPPDVGDAFADASSSLGNLNQTQASTNIPATPGGGNAPASAIGSDCTTPITRGSSPAQQQGSSTPSGTPEQQEQSSSGNSGNAYSGAPGNVVPPSELLNDPEWQAELANLKREFPELNERDLYKVIQGESRFNSTIVNKDSGATGFFQFIPSTARGLGTSTAEIQKMTPGQQLKVYKKYLGQFNYAGGPLGIMQAAPGTYSNLIRKFGGKYSNVPGNYEVYSTGSKAWTQNPGWRGPDGRITIDSINQYYGKQT